MANCYRCGVPAEIERLREKCKNCSIGGENCGLSNGGVSFVSIDAAGNDSVVRGRIAPDYGAAAREVKIETPLNANERSNLLLLLNKFAEVGADYKDAGMVCAMLGGKTLEEIATDWGVTVQAVHGRWTRLIERDPTWAAIATGMIGRGRGRKPDKTKTLEQGDLFGGMQ